MQHQIFVLTLQNDEARRQPLLDRLDEFSLPYELWFGVDGRNGLAPEMETLIDRQATRQNRGRDMGNTEFACALSHHFIYKEVLKRELPMAIILEDDAIIGPDFKAFCDMDNPLFCDLLLLDHNKAFVSRGKAHHIMADTSAFRTTLAPDLTTGYAISNTGARILIEKSLPISAPADWPWDISKMDAWAAVPRIVDHSSLVTGSSSIRHERENVVVSGRKARFFNRAYWVRKWQKIVSKVVKFRSRQIS